MKNPVMNCIFTRKSVRSFTQERVSDETLIELVRAGMAAPSARNLQPWTFVIVTERRVLDQLAERLPYAKMLFEAQAAIVVCGDLSKSGVDPEGYWVQDCSAATENILLAAEALGLGAVWTGVYPRPDRVSIVKETLGIPDHVIPLNVIPIGHPKGEHHPKDKFKETNIHWQRW